MGSLRIFFSCLLITLFTMMGIVKADTVERTTTTTTTAPTQPSPDDSTTTMSTTGSMAPGTTTTTTVTPTGPSPASEVTPNITSPAPSPSQISGRSMIVSPVPGPKERIQTPTGYVSCFTVPAGWYKDAWVPEHRICQYAGAPGKPVTYEGVGWVDSYWACTRYAGTACTKWEWKPGHWLKTLEVY